MYLKLASEDSHLTLVDVSGRITPDSFSHDSEPLAALLGPGAYHRRVLLNLTGCDYINSSGVGWLLVCHKRFRDAGGRLVIHSIPQLIRSVLEVLKMDQVFHLAGDVENARQLAAQGTAG
ncbi:MAG TPA: STAS domain-containing protein [Pirellulales bacterium]|jgi:anti-anti-sigma factor|nr:STAS domain-containing protein [Pirellulales bacterium]